ncbi:hypothetical protein WJX72_007752 [[Myrmecia] bisecta]|uniref:Uncharacterized protein n=1 Tax=[Myrmecia] bisecta TaxID=41462 RepID=A0AAW1PDR9_9CHLO
MVRQIKQLDHLVPAQQKHEAGNKVWRTHVLEEFRRHRHIADKAQASAKLQEARDYAFLVSSIQEHKELLLSYNIGIDREEVQRKSVENIARRVGLGVPTNFADRL